MEKPKSCVILGPSPMRLPWGFDEEAEECKELKLQLLQKIMELCQQGITNFIIPCDSGIGLYAAEGVLSLKDLGAACDLFCIVPYEEQATKWAPYLRERYFSVLTRCTDLYQMHTTWTEHCQFEAYQYGIERSHVVLAVYHPAQAWGEELDQAVAYAKAQKKRMLFINPDACSFE